MDDSIRVLMEAREPSPRFKETKEVVRVRLLIDVRVNHVIVNVKS
jgi:hypothetical protein